MIEYYELVKRHLVSEPMQICTAAVWSCVLCGSTIDGMGGPGGGELCVECGDNILEGKYKLVNDNNSLSE